MRTIYENRHGPERNPLALHVNYKKLFIDNSSSTGFRSIEVGSS
jgi:hypothetical protein